MAQLHASAAPPINCTPGVEAHATAAVAQTVWIKPLLQVKQSQHRFDIAIRSVDGMHRRAQFSVNHMTLFRTDLAWQPAAFNTSDILA